MLKTRNCLNRSVNSRGIQHVSFLMQANRYVIIIIIDFYDFNSSFSPLFLVSIETLYQTCETVFD